MVDQVAHQIHFSKCLVAPLCPILILYFRLRIVPFQCCPITLRAGPKVVYVVSRTQLNTICRFTSSAVQMTFHIICTPRNLT